MDMKKAFKSFLKDIGFLPLSSINKYWNKLQVVHTTEIPSKQDIKSERNRFKKEL